MAMSNNQRVTVLAFWGGPQDAQKKTLVHLSTWWGTRARRVGQGLRGRSSRGEIQWRGSAGG